MENKKNYINGLFGKVFTFSNGGEVIKLSGKTEEVIKSLQAITNEAGYFNIDGSKQRNDPTKMSFWENDFKPTPKENKAPVAGESDPDDLPF